MNNEIDIQNSLAYTVDEARLRQAINATLQLAQHDEAVALSVVVTDNAQVQALNLQFRGIDAPTDVLSFPSDMPDMPDADEPPYLGDLVIAYPYAQAQAQREDHAMADSLCLLVIHGTLHLLGYDHDTPENKAVMWALQARVLSHLHISTAIVPALESSRRDEQT